MKKFLLLFSLVIATVIVFGQQVDREDNIRVNGPVKNQVDLGQLPNGIYFMVLEGDTERYFHKLVIRK
ncbi:MAG: hypothetical protein IMY74_05950 [Bacteroidetes bacterium]|nr:hypothetical protein [Bacteroidota bacterium]MCK5764614.1 hypothetical protein [Bacteroidales bacterium]